MPPPSYTISGGSSIKSKARSKVHQGGVKEKKTAPTRPTTSAIDLKRKANISSESSERSHVIPSGSPVSRATSSIPSARPSPSYTVVRVRKPSGGYKKVLMRKPAKKPVSEPTPSRKGSESLGAPFRIKRMVKPQIRGQPAGFFSESEDEQPSRVLRSPHLALATEAYVKALGKPMIISSRVS